MRELELLGDYLLVLRRDALKQAHSLALGSGQLADIKSCAHQALLCERIHQAVQVLADDPGKFIQEYLPNEHQ